MRFGKQTELTQQFQCHSVIANEKRSQHRGITFVRSCFYDLIQHRLFGSQASESDNRIRGEGLESACVGHIPSCMASLHGSVNPWPPPAGYSSDGISLGRIFLRDLLVHERVVDVEKLHPRLLEQSVEPVRPVLEADAAELMVKLRLVAALYKFAPQPHQSHVKAAMQCASRMNS